MKNSLVVLCLAMLLPLMTPAQKAKIYTITDTAQVLFPDNKSKEFVEKEAVNQAILNGIQAKFGMVVKENNILYTVNLNTGEKVKTTENFTSWAGTTVAGECFEIKEKKCEEVFVTSRIDDHDVLTKEYRCKVTFKAREVSATKPEFDAYPLFSPCKKCQTSDFKNEDTLYLYFKSPSSGYLSVYLDDGKICQRLLPYARMNQDVECGVPIDADKEYYLFSTEEQFNYFGSMKVVDVYGLYADNVQDQNQLYVIFSDEKIAKPALKEGLGAENLTESQKGYTLPKALSTKEFQQWLSKKQALSKNLAVSTITITITKQ